MILVEGDAFVGRDEELEEIERLLAQGTRLVSVIGPPGVGKTRLALSHVQRTKGDRRKVYYCPLVSARSADSMLRLLGQSLSISSLPGDESDLDRIIKELRGRSEIRLVLDNVEQIIEEGAEIIDALLREFSSLQVIATSREPLRIRGEARFFLEPLNAKDGDLLFRKRAHEYGAQAISDADADTIAEIVRRLDGIPLALEMAAARSLVLSPKDILERLERRFSLLQTNFRKADPRQATLWAAIDASWELLTSWEQSALAQLSVFPDSFSLESAEAILSLQDFEDAPGIIDVLQSLRERSLLRAVAAKKRPAVDSMSFGIYECIREYAQEKAKSLNILQEAKSRHAGYFVRMAQQWVEAFRSTERDRALAELCRAEAHLTQALGSCQKSRETKREWLWLSTLSLPFGGRSHVSWT